MRGGGAERVNLLLLRELAAKGFGLDLVLLRKQGALLDQVPPSVRVIDLNADRVRSCFFPLIRYLRNERPDALLASMWPLTTVSVLAAKVGRFRGRLVLAEHSALSQSPQNVGLSGVALRASMRWVNSLANSVTGVSGGVVEDLHHLGLPRRIGQVIHNPVAISDARSFPEIWHFHPWMSRSRSQRLLAVGALKAAKDYPTLFSAIRRAVDSGSDVSLLVLGSGPLRSELEEYCRVLGLEGHVHFGGFVSDPAPFYRAAGLFILSSAWEGFGNVIVEALAAGTPVVSTDCRAGPREILDNGRYGSLVPVGDSGALATAIVKSLGIAHDSDALMARASDFSVEKVGNEYLDLLTSQGSS